MRTMHIVFHMGELVRYVFFREALAEQHSGVGDERIRKG